MNKITKLKEIWIMVKIWYFPKYAGEQNRIVKIN